MKKSLLWVYAGIQARNGLFIKIGLNKPHLTRGNKKREPLLPLKNMNNHLGINSEQDR